MLWAVGVRVPSAGLSDVRRALEDGSVVRSWPMRGTLHLLAPGDLRWILNITTARMIQGTGPVGIGNWKSPAADVEAAVVRSPVVWLTAVRAASREELFAAFEAAGSAHFKAQRGIHLLVDAVPERLHWCPGRWTATSRSSLRSTTGSQSRVLGREEGIAELAAEVPALRRDLPRCVTSAWWSSIPLTEVRAGPGQR